MIDSLIHDSLTVAGGPIYTKNGISSYSNWWMWVAVVEFVIILVILVSKRVKPKDVSKKKFKDESLSHEIDFNNIINSSFNSSKLYDELKTKCHPDRFPTENEKNIIAENIFQEITKNKNNIKRLLELKEEAKNKLNIN